MPGTRKLGRTSDHRTAMLRAMVTFLFENGKIETTVTRAKEVSAMAEKMITLAKVGDLHSKRQIFAYVTKEDIAKKLVDEIAPKYADRNGGYTRVIKIGPRRGDAAEMALVMLQAEEKEEPVVEEKKPAKKASKKKAEAPAVEAEAPAAEAEAPAEEAPAADAE